MNRMLSCTVEVQLERKVSSSVLETSTFVRIEGLGGRTVFVSERGTHMFVRRLVSHSRRRVTRDLCTISGNVGVDKSQKGLVVGRFPVRDTKGTDMLAGRRRLKGHQERKTLAGEEDGTIPVTFRQERASVRTRTRVSSDYLNNFVSDARETTFIKG